MARMNGNGTEPRKVSLQPDWMTAPKTIAQMSAAERSRLTEDMIGVLKALEQQAAALTKRLRDMEQNLARYEAAMLTRVERLEATEHARHRMTFMARVSWVLRGR
jgi:hypothetical protein